MKISSSNRNTINANSSNLNKKTMKKILLITSVVMCAITLSAQTGTISLNLDAAYTFKANVNFDAANANVEAAFQYGGGVEYFTTDNSSVELKYLRMDTHIPLYVDDVQLNPDIDKGSVNYILLGGNKYFGDNPDGKISPYGGLGLGLGIIGINDNTATKFAWDAKLGIKIKTSSVVSLKLQAYLQSIISTFGSDVWVSGSGTAYAVPDYATLWQFGLGGVICFDFSK
jgi:outer membrane protein W